jgi:hypothetical protein
MAHAIAADASGCGLKPSLRSRLVKAETVSEVLLFALASAAAVTHANAGIATRLHESWLPPTTSCVIGDGLHDRLGLPVGACDLSLGAARAGRAYRGSPESSAVHRAAAERLSRALPALAGVMMVPIGRGADLFGMLELGRSGHGFRRADLQALLRIARFAWQRVEQLDRCRG